MESARAAAFHQLSVMETRIERQRDLIKHLQSAGQDASEETRRLILLQRARTKCFFKLASWSRRMRKRHLLTSSATFGSHNAGTGRDLLLRMSVKALDPNDQDGTLGNACAIRPAAPRRGNPKLRTQYRRRPPIGPPASHCSPRQVEGLMVGRIA
jgi:hypothetical protein